MKSEYGPLVIESVCPKRLIVKRSTRIWFPDGVVHFFVIDYEILSSVIRIVPLFWHVLKIEKNRIPKESPTRQN
jgi:hypothetical protein